MTFEEGVDSGRLVSRPLVFCKKKIRSYSGLELRGKLQFEVERVDDSDAFQQQELLLNGEAAPVTRKRAICADNAVTWNDDGDGIMVVCLANRAERPGAADLYRKVTVSARFAIGNRAQSVPAALLKETSAQVQRATEVAKVAAEVGAKLVGIAAQMGWRFQPGIADCAVWKLVTKFEQEQTFFTGGEEQRAERRGHPHVVGGLRHEKILALKNHWKIWPLATPACKTSSIPTLLLITSGQLKNSCRASQHSSTGR